MDRDSQKMHSQGGGRELARLVARLVWRSLLRRLPGILRKPLSRSSPRPLPGFSQRPLVAITAVCLILAAPLGQGPALAEEGGGGTRSVFSLGAGSRAISLGRAFVSIADDASAVYWNPAALRNVQSKQITGMYMPVFGDFTGADYTFFGAAYPTLSAGVFGLGFMRVGTTFQGYDAESRPTEEGEYSESQFIFSYALERRSRLFLGSLATGVSFKIANQKITPYSSTSPGMDLGFRLIPDFARSISIGINLQDLLGPRHKLFQETDRTYRTVLAGAGYTRLFSSGAAFRLTLQVDFPERADREFHIGAEYAHSRFLSFRIGLDRSDFTFGLGVNVSGFGLDYAMLSREEAGSSHPVSFTTQFGRTLSDERAILAEERRLEEEALIRQAFTDRVQEHREKAKTHEAEGNFPQALDEWKIVLEYMPGDPEAEAQMRTAAQELIAEQERANRDIGKQAVISAHFSRGLSFYQENEYIRARDEWQAILSMDSTHSEAREYLARTQGKIEELVAARTRSAAVLEQQNRLVEAMGEWNHVQILDSGNQQAEAAIRRIQGKIEARSQDLQSASRRLRVVGLYGDALKAYNEGSYQAAIRNLEEALRLEPSHEEARNLLVLAKRKITPLTPEEEETIRRLYLRGMQYFSEDQYAEAIREWEKILDIDPANESVRRNIEEARERLRQLESNP